MAPEMSTVSESVKPAATASPTESEIATVAYRLWLERGGPTASDQQDWLRAEAMLKNALVVKCEDLFRRASIQCSDTRTESEMPADFGWGGHWEVGEREWGGAGSATGSTPSTAPTRPGRSRSPNWSGSPGSAGRSRSRSPEGRNSPPWTSTRPAAGPPGAAGPSCLRGNPSDW